MARTTIFAFCGAALMVALPTQAATAVPNEVSDRAPARNAPSSGAPVLLAQSGDSTVRLNQLEDEMRRLNGQVEELRFQLLQAQEDMRKRQEDNEFRFQQIEGGSASGSNNGSAPREQRGDAAPAGGSDRSTASASSAPPGGSASAGAGASADASGGNGGTDDIGELLKGSDLAAAGSSGENAGTPSSASSGTVASITPAGAGEMYDLAYNYLLAGDYQLAEQSFRQYSQTYPNAKDAPDARYWLGESLYQQQKYADAAEVFLDAQKDSPKNAKAPEMMLKLGMSLAKLNNRDVACTTYKEVSRRYPQMSANVKTKLSAEEKAANC